MGLPGGGVPPQPGLRIDLILVTRALASRCQAVEVHRDERARERPSDHVPVMAVFA